MGGNGQSAITDAAFVHLRGIHTLEVMFCKQLTITGATFAHLGGISVLNMFECRGAQVTVARNLGLPVLTHACTVKDHLHQTQTYDERA